MCSVQDTFSSIITPRNFIDLTLSTTFAPIWHGFYFRFYTENYELVLSMSRDNLLI